MSRFIAGIQENIPFVMKVANESLPNDIQELLYVNRKVEQETAIAGFSIDKTDREPARFFLDEEALSYLLDYFSHDPPHNDHEKHQAKIPLGTIAHETYHLRESLLFPKGHKNQLTRPYSHRHQERAAKLFAKKIVGMISL